MVLVVKNPPANARDIKDVSLIPELGRSLEEELTPVFLPEESHGQRSLEGYNLWDHKKSDMTEQLTLALFFQGKYLMKKTSPFRGLGPM